MARRQLDMSNRFRFMAITALVSSLSTAGIAKDGDERRTSAGLAAAREKFFGAENVNPFTGGVRKDRVIFSWATNTTYAVSVKGRVFLLDSFVTRLEQTPGRTPFVIQDLVDLHPEVILLGHGHGDHADNAAFIAGTLKIPIVATPETCDVMQIDAVRIFGPGSTVNCIGAVSRGSDPGAELNKLDILRGAACVTVFKHVHSGRVAHDPTVPLVTVVNDQDQRDAEMFPAGTPLFNDPKTDYRTTGFGGAAGIISLFFQFVVPGDNRFTFVWHNTTGPLKESAFGATLFGLMDHLPKTDVELGSVVSLGYPTNGERDIVLYTQHVQPKVFVPGHMTAVAKESSSLRWKVAFEQELNVMNASYRPEARWMVDPVDYLRPLVFDPKEPRWASGDRETSSSCQGGED
jgi:hypothetical protein